MLYCVDNIVELDTPACRAFWHMGWRLRHVPSIRLAIISYFDRMLRGLSTPWFDQNPEWLKWVLSVLEACKNGFGARGTQDNSGGVE